MSTNETDLQQSKLDRTQANEELSQARQDLERQKYFGRIYLRARNSKGQALRTCQANEAAIEEAHMNVALFLEAVKQDSFASHFVWQNVPASKTDPKQLEKDRQTLAQAARANGNFGASDANLSLCRDVLGAGFTEYQINQAIRSNALLLAAPSEEERECWEAERIEQENQRLLNADSRKLKQEIRDRYADRQREAAQAHADYEFELRQQAEQNQFPQLPEIFDGPFPALRGKRLDSQFLVRHGSRELFKFLHTRFGVANVTARLRGIR
jgi:hypothetical protein